MKSKITMIVFLAAVGFILAMTIDRRIDDRLAYVVSLVERR